MFSLAKRCTRLNADTKDEYIKFIDSFISTDLPNEETEPVTFNLVNQYQTHSHSNTCRKYKNIPCRFNFGRFFTDRTIYAEPLPKDINDIEKNISLILVTKS